MNAMDLGSQVWQVKSAPHPVPLVQVPQVPPQPSAPHDLLVQSGWQQTPS
jgi:hypothetical protein